MPTLSMLPNEYPDPYYTIRKIREMTRYIDENGSIRIHKVPLSLINKMMLYSQKNCESFSDNDVFDTNDTSFFFCFSIFHHIYLNQYQEYDLISFENFQSAFIEFQRFLWEIAGAYKRHGGWIKDQLPRLKLFDLKNMSTNLDVMRHWKIEWA